ncbi:hypothetical protein [Algoriphagus terrigena]|uniref:hypothetical protein n=1 Tax=Algoriphagus terrigena TaxID=344884 RepID=UPI0003F56AC1|nr:hypothetical protein [Algoriphagus terrigena]
MEQIKEFLIQCFYLFKNDPLSFFALIFSIIAAYYARLAILLKTGNNFGFSYLLSDNFDSNGYEISEYIVENKKDKSAILFKIYLKIGYNNFLLLDDFTGNPVTLKPFEYYRKKLEQSIFYSMNMNIIKIPNLIKKYSLKILIETSEGTFFAKPMNIKDSVLSKYFSNHYTNIIHSENISFHNIPIKKSDKYGIELIFKAETKHLVISEEDRKFRLNKDSELSESDLVSKDFLESKIHDLINGGSLNCLDFKVYDIQMFMVLPRI